jgi:hypothetical protein
MSFSTQLLELVADYTKYSDEDLIAAFSVQCWVCGSEGKRTDKFLRIESEILQRMKAQKS